MRHWAMLTTESAAAAGKYPPHATPSQKKVLCCPPEWPSAFPDSSWSRKGPDGGGAEGAGSRLGELGIWGRFQGCSSGDPRGQIRGYWEVQGGSHGEGLYGFAETDGGVQALIIRSIGRNEI